MFSDEQKERVTETTRIISEDEVPPEILAEIRRKEASHANTVTKIIGAGNDVNVGAMMSAARPKINEPSDTKLQEYGTNLMAKFIKIGKAGDEEFKRQRDERIQTKTQNFLDTFRKGQQIDK